MLSSTPAAQQDINGSGGVDASAIGGSYGGSGGNVSTSGSGGSGFNALVYSDPVDLQLAPNACRPGVANARSQLPPFLAKASAGSACGANAHTQLPPALGKASAGSYAFKGAPTSSASCGSSHSKYITSAYYMESLSRQSGTLTASTRAGTPRESLGGCAAKAACKGASEAEEPRKRAKGIALETYCVLSLITQAAEELLSRWRMDVMSEEDVVAALRDGLAEHPSLAGRFAVTLRRSECKQPLPLQHAFLQVVDTAVDACERAYIVDPAFCCLFETAGQTAEYAELAALLPCVLVLAERSLPDLLHVLCGEAAAALMRSGARLPAWREPSAMARVWQVRAPPRSVREAAALRPRGADPADGITDDDSRRRAARAALSGLVVACALRTGGQPPPGRAAPPPGRAAPAPVCAAAQALHAADRAWLQAEIAQNAGPGREAKAEPGCDGIFSCLFPSARA